MRAVLYDFDGLLLDSETAGLKSWRRVYALFGQELDLDSWLAEITAGRGPCMPTDALDGLVDIPIDWPRVEEQRLIWRDELLIPRPGALGHLAQAVALDLPTAIVSNAPDWWVAEQLERSGIGRGHHFDVVITKAHGLAKKPAPDSYLAALSELGCSPGDALAFEDSPVGIEAARAAGVACVAVPNEVTAHFDLSRADLQLTSLDAQPLAQVMAEILSCSRPSGKPAV